MKQLSKGFGKQQCRFRRALMAGLLLLPLVLADRGFALDPARSLQQYNCRTWSRQNGLPANGITAIAQTQDGYLWLGTSVGLVRFDGIDFKPLDISSVTNLSSSIVTSLASARNGGIWAGLESSAFGFCDGQSFSFRGQPAWGGVGMNVRSIMESEDGTLWFAAAEFGAARLTRSGTFEQLMASGPFTNGSPNALCCYEDHQGRVWFGTPNQGLYYWQAGKLTKVADPALDATLIFSIAEDHEEQIWVGTVDGLHCLDSNLRPKATFPLDVEVRALLVDEHDVLWVGTVGNGLGRFRDGTFEFLHRADGLGSEYVNALAEDREGSLWIGMRGGVSQLTDVKFPTYPATEDPSVKDALAVCASHQGGVWIGSPRGVTYFDPVSGTRNTYGLETGIPRYIKRVFEAGNGDLYMVCYPNALAILSPEKKLVAVYTNSTSIVGMAEDARGVVVSVGGELYRAGTNYFQPYAYTNVEKPPMWWILNLASGKDGVIWVACGGGIFRVKDGAYKQWFTAEGLSTAVLDICEDTEGVVWGATMHGIVRLKDNRISLIDRKHGLFDDNIYAVIPDDFGNLWVDSGQGIFSVSRQSVNDFADGKTARVQCTVYDGMDSVKLADKTSQQERVACKTSDGRIWFPEANGAVMIDPAHIPTNRVAPQVHIDLVKADGREVARSEAVTVPPGKGELEFQFDALTFIVPQKARFRYRLQGYDNDWVDAGNRRLAFYTNLKPGPYTFQVIAANADGVWNERGDTLNVELRPHYYQTAWFRLLCGGLAFAALIGIYLLRVRRLNLQQQALQKNRDLLEYEVERRTVELAKTNAVLQEKIAEHKRTEMALLESQALYQALVSQTPAGLFRKDREGRFVVVNPVFCQLKGLSAEEILGKTPRELDDYERAREAAGLLKQPPRQRMLAVQGEDNHKRIMRTGETIEVEEVYPQPDGTVEYFHVVKTPVFDALGMVIGSQGMQFDITEPKRAEEKLILFRALIEGSNDAIHVVDPATGRFLDVNESACRALGYTRDEHLALTVFDVVEIEREHFHATIERAKKEGHATVEVLHRRKDGTRFPVEVSLSPVTIDREYLLAVVRDITERKQAEVALNYERDLLRTLLDNSPDNIYFKDTQSRFVKASKSLARVFGVASPDEMTGKTDFDFFDEAHARPAFEDEQSIIRTGLPMIGKEEREVWKDGHVTWVSSTKMPWFDGTGKIIGIIGVSRDITSQKLAEKQLRQLSSAVEHSPASIVITDPAGNIEYVNPKFTESSGYSAEEVVGKNPRILKSGGTPDAEYQQMWQTILSGREWRGEFHNRKKNGELYWELASISAILDDAGKISHFVAVKEDITEKKKLESQLLRSQRMESIGTLAGGIAHDLNNVLAPLLISVELLKEKVSDDAGRRLLDSLEANVNRGASLVKQVLTFGRGIKGERIPIHLKHIGDEIAQLVRETFPKSLKFEIQCADGLWTVTGDPTQLEQVLMNLCVNARDAMPGGGTLSLRMENRVLDKDHTTANLEAKPGNYVVISVSDTGTGMAPEIRDRIFEPFFTTKEQGKGTGLGLSTALAIVKSHGGFINCYSEVGKGSVFKVYLPASPDAANVKPAAANQSRLLRGNNELVLVVDDEEPIRILAKSMLERFGYRVLLADNGTEAVKLYTSRRNEIAAVITDMSMPGMDGPATIAALRGINPEVKVIGSSGLDVRDGMTGVVNAGLVHFMSKPYTAETVLNMLREILRENPAK